jgi:hypothetical protein
MQIFKMGCGPILDVAARTSIVGQKQGHKNRPDFMQPL